MTLVEALKTLASQGTVLVFEGWISSRQPKVILDLIDEAERLNDRDWNDPDWYICTTTGCIRNPDTNQFFSYRPVQWSDYLPEHEFEDRWSDYESRGWGDEYIAAHLDKLGMAAAMLDAGKQVLPHYFDNM